MLNQDELNQIKLQYAAFRAANPPKQVTPTTSKKKGNFFTHLIPSAGGVGGATGGAAIGTALLPGVGTLAGALLGGALGGGAGKVAENKVEGQALGNGVAGEAAINGVFGAGPLRLAKVGVDAVRGVRAGADLAGAITSASTKAVNSSITKTAGDKLQKAGQGLIAKEFRLNPTQQANFKNLHGEEAVSVLRRYGIKKPEDIAAKIEPLQGAFNSVVQQIPAASKAEVSAAMQAVYEPLIKSPVITRRQLGQQVKAQADAILKKSGKEIGAPDLNGLKQAFDDAVTYTQKGTNEFTVNKKSADAIRKLLQTKADQAGLKFEGKTFRDVGLELRKLHNLNDVVGKQSYLGTGSLPVSLGNLPGVTAGGAAGGLPGAVVGFGANAVLNSSTGRRALATGFLKGGEKLTAKGVGTNPYSIGKTASRIAPAGLVDALMGNLGQSDVNSTPMTAMSTNANTMPSNTNMGRLSHTDANLSTSTDQSSPFAPQNIESSVRQIVSNGGTLKDAQDFISLAEALQKMQAPAASPKLNAAQLQQANNANSGLADLQTLAETIQQDPSVLFKDAVPGGGFARRLTGTNNYEAAKQNVVDVISRLRSGAAITEGEARRYMSLLPGAADTPESATQKLQRLASLLSSFSNPQAAQSSPTDLASAILAAQGGYQ